MQNLVFYLGAGNSTNTDHIGRKHLDLMRRAGYSPIVCDPPGHGAQSSTQENIDLWAVEMATTIRVLAPHQKHIFLVGVSLGGHVVFRVAAELRRLGYSNVFPIVQGSPPAAKHPTREPPYEPRTDKLRQAFPLLAKAEFTEEEARLFVECQFTDDFVAEHPDEIKGYVADAMKTTLRDKFVPSLFESTFDEMAAVSAHTQQQPYLVIQAADDAGVNPKYLDLIPKEALYKQAVQVLPGGHQLMPSEPEAFTNLVLEYIKHCRTTNP